MSCPRCFSEKIVSAGFYVTKLFRKRSRFRCNDCGRNFIIGRYLTQISLQQEREIIRLSKKINPHASWFDNRKIGRIKTYSNREIGKILGVGQDTIKKVLENNNNKRI